MKWTISKAWTVLSIALLVTGVSSYAVVKARKYQASLQQGYTLVQQQIRTFPGKDPVIDFVSVRYKRSDGNFVETRERGGKQFYLAFTHAGKFLKKSKDGSHLEMISEHHPTSGWKEEALSKDPRLRKDNPIEWIAGVKCYVIRSKDDEISVNDIYIAPSIGAILQVVTQSKNGNGSSTLKTVSLVFGEPDSNVFANLPVNLPVEPGPIMN
jgi:hypothetical protein